MFLDVRGRVGAAAPQETREGLIWPVIVHSLQNLVDLREKVAGREPTVLEAPIIAVDLADRDLAVPECIHNLRRTPMNELSSQLNWKLLDQVLERVDSLADPAAGLQNNDGQAFCCKFRRCNQPSGAGANYDHVRAILFREFALLTRHSKSLTSEKLSCDRTRAQLG